MPRFEIGGEIGIPCDLGMGAFPGEYLVTIESTAGPISGFVKEAEIVQTHEDEGLVRATIQDVSDDTLTVWIRGSFFQTTGLAYLHRDWAAQKVQEFANQ